MNALDLIKEQYYSSDEEMDDDNFNFKDLGTMDMREIRMLNKTRSERLRRIRQRQKEKDDLIKKQRKEEREKNQKRIIAPCGKEMAENSFPHHSRQRKCELCFGLYYKWKYGKSEPPFKYLEKK
jgi:hypothetical protein